MAVQETRVTLRDSPNDFRVSPAQPHRENPAKCEEQLAREVRTALFECGELVLIIAATSQSSTAHAPADRGPPSKNASSPSTDPAPTRATRPMLSPSPEWIMTSSWPWSTKYSVRFGSPCRISASPAITLRMLVNPNSCLQSSSRQLGS